MVTSNPASAEVIEPLQAVLPVEAEEHAVGPIVLQLPPEWRFTADDFCRLADCNELLDIEISAEGELIIAPLPVGKGPGVASDITIEVGIWSRAGGGGQVRGADGGFRLDPPIGEGRGDLDDSSGRRRFEVRGPDVSWMSDAQLESMPDGYEDTWPNVAPAFAVEIISRSQTMASQQRKMDMWMSYGVRLAWLIDPRRELVWIYRAGADEPELLERPSTLSGEDVMRGFSLDCSLIWSDPTSAA